MLPTFIGLGAQRAGTTWIHRCLSEHTEISVPEAKELRFFNRQFDLGVAWYERQFDVRPGQKAVGEITPNYLHAPVAIERMRTVLPAARLFAVLREPIARAYSAYSLYHDQYEGLSFRQACQQGGHLIRLSSYADALDCVFACYPQEQVKILLYDDLEADPAGLLSELFHFLGVDPMVRPPSLHKRYNRVMYPRAQAVVSRIGAGGLLGRLKQTRAGEWIKRRHARSPRTAAALDADDVRYLKDVFCSDILRVQRLIGRDLSAWLESGPKDARL